MKKKSTAEFNAKFMDHSFQFNSDGFSTRVIKFDSIHELHRFPVGYEIVKGKSRPGRVVELEQGRIHGDVFWATGYESNEEAVENARCFKNEKFVKQHDEWRRANPGVAESFAIAPRRKLVRGDYGSELDTQKYLAGKVDSMWNRRQKIKQEKRNHRIVMLQGGNAYVKPEELNFSAFAAMEMMLNIGTQAEFVVVYGNNNCGTIKQSIIDTVVKKSGRTMCRSTASYAASVMMFRIGAFGILESMHGIGDGLGSTEMEANVMKYVAATYAGSYVVPFIRSDDELKSFLAKFREGKLKPIGANQ